jgi:hypothetical protein
MIKTNDEKEITIALLKGHGLQSTCEKQRAIQTALTRAITSDQRGRVGEIIKDLPKEIRDILKDCKDKDWYHRMEFIE